jgi:hypothetical protein
MKQALEKENQAFAWRERTMTQRKAELMKLLPMFQSDPFTWMTVADYFICRHSHEISFIPGTEEHFDATLRHLSFRFHQFYSHRAILELVAGRITRHILTEIDRAVNEHNQYKPLVVYSGHDVSVLAMLHVIQASIVDDVSWWPAYSSALTLELLEDEEGKFFIQARLDGKILELRDRTNALYPVEEFKDLSLDAIGSIQEK